MDAKLKIVFLLAFSTANAGYIAFAPRILEGPSTRTILVGPDGSQISALLPGGRIVLEDGHGPLLQGIPEVVAIPSIAQPVPIPVHSGAIGDISVAAVEVPSAVAAVDVPSVDTETKTDVETVSVDSAVVEAKSAPVNATEVEVSSESESSVDVSSTEAPQVASEETVQVVESSSNNATSSESSSEASASTTETPKEDASVKSVKAPVALAYSHIPEYGDFEGKYVPDDLEKLFDDGSYRPSEFLW